MKRPWDWLIAWVMLLVILASTYGPGPYDPGPYGPGPYGPGPYCAGSLGPYGTEPFII